MGKGKQYELDIERAMNNPTLFTTIDWDWGRRAERWRTHGMYIPVVNEDDERALVCTLHLDARGLNTGWEDTMPVQSTGTSVFVDDPDPRNGNPPLVVTADG